MISQNYRSAAASSSAWIPLLYDTIIFGLTLYRTVPPIRREEASYIIKRLLEDGLLYYSVIFTVTCVLTFMIVAAPPGTKNIAAQMEQLITVAMMSRITLNLKKAGEQLSHSDGITSSKPKSLLFDRARKRRRSSHLLDNPSFTISTLPAPALPTTIISQIGTITGPGNELVFSHPVPGTPATMDSETYFNGEGNLERRPAPVLLSSKSTYIV
uniref:Uncharacterized protein n=1 Tax=Psilocybe cubensis TaxID=181762 RepID=A0A8H8CEY6_PSICU